MAKEPRIKEVIVMSELDQETKNAMWKIRALLIMRSLYKEKKLDVKRIAEMWKITERQAYYYLAEADELCKHLAPLVRIQPDLDEASADPSSESLKEPLA